MVLSLPSMRKWTSVSWLDCGISDTLADTDAKRAEKIKTTGKKGNAIIDSTMH